MDLYDPHWPIAINNASISRVRVSKQSVWCFVRFDNDLSMIDPNWATSYPHPHNLMLSICHERNVPEWFTLSDNGTVNMRVDPRAFCSAVREVLDVAETHARMAPLTYGGNNDKA